MTLYFVSPAPRIAAGGVQRIYDIAATLNRTGIDSVVVHPKGQGKPTWFDRDEGLETLSTMRVKLGKADALVVPEKYAWALRNQAMGIARVIFCQGAYLMFEGGSLPPVARGTPYTDPNVAMIITVSEDNLRYVQYAFPRVPSARIRLGIDPDMFRPLDKRNQIAFMPRRGESVAKQVLGIAAAHGSLEGWHILPLDGLSHKAVGQALGESRIFLSLPHAGGEGFLLPAAEAMAAGCLVIGYSGRGGAEYFDSAHSFEIPGGDVVRFAQRLEEALGDGRLCMRMGESARAFILSRYAPAKQTADVISIFQTLSLDSSPGGGILDLSSMAGPSLMRKVLSRGRHLLD